MSGRQYGAISFAHSLAGQDPAIKLAALASLNSYFKDERIKIWGETFWSWVEEFHNETDGLHTSSTKEILRISIPQDIKGNIERLGFSVSPIKSAIINDG